MRTLIFGVFILAAVLAGTSRTTAQDAKPDEKQAIVTVKGMQCPFCAFGIQKQLKKLDGVKRVEVELEKSQAIVTLTPDSKLKDADLERAIRKAGFTPGKIEWKTAPVTDKKKTTLV